MKTTLLRILDYYRRMVNKYMIYTTNKAVLKEVEKDVYGKYKHFRFVSFSTNYGDFYSIFFVHEYNQEDAYSLYVKMLASHGFRFDSRL